MSLIALLSSSFCILKADQPVCFFYIQFFKMPRSLFLITFLIVTQLSAPKMTWAQMGPDGSTRFTFDSETLDRVDILIEEDSLALILAQGNEQSDYEYPATFIYSYRNTDGMVMAKDTLGPVGFRLRGNTSRNSAKKSFKVSFNTFQSGQQYRGLDKMNLNGEHNDPTVMRALLSWNLLEAVDVPAPKSAPVEFYINGEFKGLYLNVEHIDDEFVQHRFGSDAGNLYKNLYPADLAYRGSNPDAYKFSPSWTDRRTYELKTNTDEDDYSDLATLISVLERTSDALLPETLEAILNVDNTLRWMAIDILTGNWDNYWYNKNNFYLYRNPASNRFEFIPYDYDNTFGIDFIGPDWGTRSWINWGHPNEGRPLTDRLMDVPEYRQRLDYYLQLLSQDQGVFSPNHLYPEIDRLAVMMQEAVERDPYRGLDWGFSPESFMSSIDQELGGHVKYGLKPYIATRQEASQSQNTESQILPVIRKQNSLIQSVSEDSLELTVAVEWIDDDPWELVLGVQIGTYSKEFTLEKSSELPDMLRATTPDPTFANPEWGVVTQTLPWVGDQLHYYLRARSQDGAVKRFPRDPSSTITLQVSKPTKQLLINELMADNETTISDESGAFEDWVELYNPGTSTVQLSNYFLSDDLQNPGKWALPDTSMAPGNYLLIWTDNDAEEGPLHSSFALSKHGEEVGLFYKDVLSWIPIDSVRFPALGPDQSFGRPANNPSLGFSVLTQATPGSLNADAVNIHEDPRTNTLPSVVELLGNYPNPFNPSTVIRFRVSEPQWIRLRVYNTMGQVVHSWPRKLYSAGDHNVSFTAQDLASGTYWLRLESEFLSRRGTSNTVLTQPMLLVR